MFLESIFCEPGGHSGFFNRIRPKQLIHSYDSVSLVSALPI